jgi:hypothetical protein
MVPSELATVFKRWYPDLQPAEEPRQACPQSFDALYYRSMVHRPVYPPNSSSNTLASWRSAVSKPSVNQR